MWVVTQPFFSGQWRHPVPVISVMFFKSTVRSEVYESSPNFRVSFALRGNMLRVHNEECLTARSWYVKPYPLWKGYPHVPLVERHLGPLLMETAETTKEYPAPTNPIRANSVEENIWKGGETTKFLDCAEIVYARLHHSANLVTIR